MTNNKQSLKRILDDGGFLAAPGVFDMISVKMADRIGFDALYMTGYGTVASHLGLPDAGLASYADMVGRVQQMAAVASTPIICDGDTGYGGLLNVRHTVEGYERAGAAAIQIEDQEFPKKCGHTPGRRVIPLEDMVDKIRVAVDSRDSEDFLIVARTDARTAHGLEEAIRRGQAFEDAGADIIFVESPESIDEMERICKTITKPKLANIVDGGRTPVLPAGDLKSIGYQVAIYPGTGFLAVGAALDGVYRHIAETGSSANLKTPMYDFLEFSRLMGFEDVWEFDKNWSKDS